MAIELPSGLAGLFKVLTGMPWPQGNEDSLRAVGKLYTVTSQEFDELADVVGQLVSAIGQGFEGETASAFVGSMKKLISGDDFLGAAKEGAAELAEFAEDTANTIEYMKWMILATLIELLAELAFYAATSWFNWGAPAEAAAAEAVARFSIRAVMKAALRRLIQHAVIGLLTAVTMDRLIQSIQKWQGHRTHYDNALLVQSIEFAVISSAVGVVLEPLGGKLGSLLGDMLGHDFGKNVGDSLATFFKSDLGPLSAGETKAFASDLGRVAGDNGRGLANGFGKDTGAGVERESAGGPSRDALGGSFDQDAVFAFRNDMGEIFARHLGASLGPGQARELGRDFGDTFAAGWGRKALTDVKNDLGRVLAEHVGVLGKEGAESLAHGMPEAVLNALVKGTGTDWGRKAGELVTTSVSSGVNMTLTTGFYNLIFGPDHTFETSLDSFVGGAAMGAIGHGGRMAIDHYSPHRTKIDVPDFDKEFGGKLAVRTEGEPAETASAGTPPPSAGSSHGDELPSGRGFRTTSTAGQDAHVAVDGTTRTAEPTPAAQVRTSAQGRPSRTVAGPGEEVAAPLEVRSTSSTDAERGAHDGAGGGLREPQGTGSAVRTSVRTSGGGRGDAGSSTGEEMPASRGAGDSSSEVAVADGGREGSVPRGMQRVPAGADAGGSAGEGPSRSAGVEGGSGRHDGGGAGELGSEEVRRGSPVRTGSADATRSAEASGVGDDPPLSLSDTPMRPSHSGPDAEPDPAHRQPGMVVRPRAPQPGSSTGTDAALTPTPEPEMYLAAESTGARPEPPAPSTVLSEADLIGGLRAWLNRPELLDTVHNGERLGGLTDLRRAELLLQHPELDPQLAGALGRPDVGRDLADVMLPNGTAEAKATLAAKISAAVVRQEFRDVLHDPSRGKALAKEMGLPATGPKVTAALKRAPGRRVLWQPGYATGDQFGIAAALMGDKDLHVVVVTGMPDRVATDKGASIERFYKDSGIDASRIHLVRVEEGQKADEAASLAAVEILGPHASEVKKRLVPVGTGTTWVADNFSVETRRLVRSHWRLDDAGFTAGEKSHLSDWLGKKSIVPSPDRNTIVLWSRFSGKKGDVHVEHDTSYQGIRQILDSLKLDKERTGGVGPLVVIAGDAFADGAKAGKYPEIARMFSNQGLEVHDLTHFWDPEKDSGAHAALKSWGGDSRIGQMKLYEYLRQSSSSVRHLGFRSGNLEALAMSGHTVRYMEEPGSHGGERMAKWHAAQNSPLTVEGKGKFEKGLSLATGYERLVVTHPPTRSGQYITYEKGKIKTPEKGDEAARRDAKTRNDALLHPDWVFGAHKGVAKPKKTADFTKGFAPDDLPRITDYLTGPVHSLRPHPVPSVPHGTAPHAHETAPHTRGTPHGESQSTVTPRAPVPMSSTASVAHTAAHDAPAATHSLKQGPKAFLEGATVLMRTSDGMKARTPGLTMDYEKFIKWMDGKDRHWFTLTPHVDSARAGREVYLLTPAVEKYAHEFADDPALRYLLDGHNLPGLRGQDEYLAAHYVPYFPGKPTRPDAEIGHADIPMERGDGFSPDFVFTAAMNGCAFTVTRGEAEGSFRAWHFQSPTTNRDESQLFRLDRRPTDWFGDGEYQSPLDQSVTPETTNIMWRGEDGWHFVSQENHTTRENVNDVWTKQVSSRPVHFDGSRRLDYVLRFYTRTTEDRLLKLRWYHQDYTSRLDSSPSSLHLKGAWTLHAEQARRDVEALGGVRSLEDLKETLTKLEADQKATRGLMQYYFKEQEKAFGDERDTLLRQQASSWWPGAMAAAVRKLDEMERLQGQVRFWIDDLSDPKWLLGLQKEAAGLTEPAPEPRAVSAPAPAGDPAQSTPHPMGAQGAPAHSTHWQAVRAKTPHVTRSHRWVDPISRPLGGAGHNVPRYVVASKFDARRFDVSGQRYTDLTVKVHMDGTGQVTAGQLDAVWGRAQAGVDRLFNSPGHTLPDGSVLHVTLERAESGTAAHLKATVGPHGTPSSQDMWAVDADDQVLAHELGHQLGLRDEYREATPERDEDQGTTSKHRPEITGSLMGDFTRAPKDDLPRGGMRDRYLHLLNAIIGDLDTATPTSAAAQTPRASGGTYGGVAPRAPQNGAATTGEIPETPLTPVHQPPELDGYINPAAGSPALTAGAADQSAAPAFSAAGADTHPVADVEPGAGGPRTVAEDQIFRVLSAGTGPDRDTPVGPAGDASSERSSGALPEDGDDGPGSPGHAPIPQLDDARQ